MTPDAAKIDIRMHAHREVFVPFPSSIQARMDDGIDHAAAHNVANLHIAAYLSVAVVTVCHPSILCVFLAVDYIDNSYGLQAWTWDFIISTPDEVRILFYRRLSMPDVAYILARYVIDAFLKLISVRLR